MLALKRLLARRLSRRGEHTAALAMCNMRDIQVLSQAGMHLSVLASSTKPSIERSLALAHVGELDAAIEMAKEFRAEPAARMLFGYLATQLPGRVQRIIAGLAGVENINAYCQYETGNATYSERDLKKLTPLHGMAMALKAGNSRHAKERFETLFSSHGLVAPKVEWMPNGLQYASLPFTEKVQTCSSGPLISVILTAYNEEKYLRIALGSLLAQSWSNLEIILVNDASTDGTGEIAEEMARVDSRIQVVHLKQNVGLWAAKNIGLQHCKGEVITMHDADDWSHPFKLQLQAVPLLENRRLLATTSYLVRVDENSGLPFTRNACNYLRWNPSSFMFRASLVKMHGGFVDRLLGSDCEFVARIETLYGARSHQRLRSPLSIGLQRSHSLSNRFRAKQGQGLIRLEHWESWRQQQVSVLANRSM